ncbi:hypothetical protein OIU35_05870 [Boseaceae bacterium BT-24-1]|jgi:hypothetical protein|uniref:hypothetical protein n=1 Tax=Bosea sp. (in: a-proteobacteria) TaxID=1871050 RepID=UPI002DDD8504|nr:hypothetical protein [Bosea sp. (in: a-proteobacteria)]MCV9935883.1 hypothetical protein [Boseaceae bacterium BT-24-1]HEV2511084.1 hypothetical protein [Bosea sp. (in: a-proteobacteria)]
MTYVLNSTDVLPAATRAETTETKTAGQGFWQRLYAAMIESRRRSALRELRAHSYLVRESELVLGGFPATTLKSDAELPFNR